MLYGYVPASRLLLGTALYPSDDIMADAVRASGTEIVTVALRRETGVVNSSQVLLPLIHELKLRVLPNTAGCRTAREAVTMAYMTREVFGTPWIKLEVVNDDAILSPNVFELVEAARVLGGDGFEIFPYTTEDLLVAERLVAVGCRVLMPWAAPVGSGRGLNNPYSLRSLRAHFPDISLIIDAGLGLPSHAAAAMELGYDAVLLNTAIAEANDPVTMARAFAHAIEAGRLTFQAGPMKMRETAAQSTPVLGQPVLA